MSAEENQDFDFLPILGLIADVAGIVAFVGLDSHRGVRLGVTIAVVVLAAGAGAVALWRRVRLWASPSGSYYKNSVHVRQISSSFLVLVLAITVGIAAIWAA